MESTRNGGRMGEWGAERSLLQDPDETGETLMENRKESENCLSSASLVWPRPHKNSDY